MQKISVYEKSGEKHVFEVCRQNIKGAAPYALLCYAYCEYMCHQCVRTVKSAYRRFKSV